MKLSFIAASLDDVCAGHCHEVGSNLGLSVSSVTSFCALITVIHSLPLNMCSCFPALLGASPHQPGRRGFWRGLLPGLCSCFAYTQEALPESFPHKVSPPPICAVQEGKSQTGLWVFFCTGFECCRGCTSERKEHFEYQPCSLSHCFFFSEPQFPHQ